uniref:Uncharacterized protein n=1 Tax=Arion vulgaris TaxID=1028688 RepID=A0A0B6ZBL0_9EUPU
MQTTSSVHDKRKTKYMDGIMNTTQMVSTSTEHNIVVPDGAYSALISIQYTSFHRLTDNFNITVITYSFF